MRSAPTPWRRPRPSRASAWAIISRRDRSTGPPRSPSAASPEGSRARSWCSSVRVGSWPSPRAGCPRRSLPGGGGRRYSRCWWSPWRRRWDSRPRNLRPATAARPRRWRPPVEVRGAWWSWGSTARTGRISRRSWRRASCRTWRAWSPRARARRCGRCCPPGRHRFGPRSPRVSCPRSMACSISPRCRSRGSSSACSACARSSAWPRIPAGVPGPCRASSGSRRWSTDW